MKRWSWLLAVVALGCQGGRDERPTRAEVRKTGPATMEVVPRDGQLPYCMLFTVSEKGVIRQLTLTRENRSIRCDANKPVAHTSFRVPVQEGKVKVYIFFSDDRIPAGPVAQQLYDLRANERINAMDLRLPGRVFVETLEFTPEDGAPGANGEAGGVAAQDIGAPVLKDGGVPEGAPTTSEDGS